MVVPHDMYEDDDDDFCCGRAYGGSRIAVVSMARYNPALDVLQDIEREHAWPTSHCQTYVEGLCDLRVPLQGSEAPIGEKTAMHAAVAAISPEPATTSPQEQKETMLWLGRVCKTASHELGHCFGIDHCTYFACIMQGTAGLVEDARQPPYLCPVDLAKILRAIALAPKEPASSDLLKRAETNRYGALREFCLRWPEDRMFQAFQAWLDHRIAGTEQG
ncbi:hypothetical protein K431DRAFT_287145 [Polychaeton citri CBS 116435]|uniref:Zincin n=1 Tax=Polychaeton citri CBS 116435 TaxID=1314669 RepID=A0A9P4Q1P7_9PEZI|nr:hypothetical protein K431DRAFT_287145 [Polychaeton citri CBS 116435]